ncbi:DNA replication/repair protein RecF [Apilactobacillus xinyiensis]|uniref:DNA replication/repair protein RecF n=1 Tax=Apilactobacillus xinyiensis TaxID=2841032 RepID=UPI00200E1C19|nr:DNA replication/repair protein RecF [Apilactobacillus xinyiensis]MCL0330174.1 DNA replication/repair protein RecF [Apilactobacillus xinyiensis]
MRITTLQLRKFRNYEDVSIEFNSGVNVLLGNNAQGKTNLLESIYVLALTKSHRTANNKELISWHNDYAQLKGVIKKHLGNVNLEIDLGKKGKKAKVNYLEQAKLSSYIGNLNVILFAPEDLSIVKGSPSVRRKFMDTEFSQISSQYLYNTTQYKKILKQRNNYLKKIQYSGKKDEIYLEVISKQLANFGSKIIFQRLNLLKKLENWAKSIHSEISQNMEELTFKYLTSVELKNLPSRERIYEMLLASLMQNQDKEIHQGTTLYGPHRDDVQFLIDKRNVQTFGSQGQQRTTALSLKLSEIDLMKEETGEYPILLLDDVLSELDDGRQTHLLNAIQNKVQTFITTTSLNGMTKDLAEKPAIFNINNGKLSKNN